VARVALGGCLVTKDGGKWLIWWLAATTKEGSPVEREREREKGY